MADRFAGRRIAVTGAAGGIGAALCASLLAQGADVYALDAKGLDALPEGVLGVETDLTVGGVGRRQSTAASPCADRWHA